MESMAPIIIISLFLVFCWYINPFRKGEPSRVQVFMAKAWITLRRIVCFIGVLFVLLGIIPVVLAEAPITTKIGYILFLVLTAGFLTFAGIVGQGWHRGQTRDDIKQYKKIKEVYKWR